MVKKHIKYQCDDKKIYMCMCGWVDESVRGMFLQTLRREIAFLQIPTPSINSSHPQPTETKPNNHFWFEMEKEKNKQTNKLKVLEVSRHFVGYVYIFIYLFMYISSLLWGGSQAAVSTLGGRGQMFPLLPGWYYPGNNIMFMQTAFDIIALKQLKIGLCLQAKQLDHRLCYIPLLQ